MLSLGAVTVLALAAGQPGELGPAAKAVRLLYVREAGVEGCPAESQAGSATIRSGPDARSTLLVRVAKSARGFAGSIELIDEAGAVAGQAGAEHRRRKLRRNGASDGAIDEHRGRPLPILSGNRLRFDILIAEPMRSWCQRQTPYVDGVTGVEWNCRRSGGSGRTIDPVVCFEVDPCTGEEVQVSCAPIDICGNPSRPCVCNETGCDGNTGAKVYHSFDLRFEGDEATGQVNDSVVHLTRD
jgi:hypothetical protein